MAANTNPIFPLTPKISWTMLAAANAATDGTGTVGAVFTAGTNGARIDWVRIRAAGSNVPTVVRFFINNGSSNAIAANNTLYHEITLTATTGSAVVALDDIQWDCNLVLPNGYKLMATVGTAIASGVAITAVGGDY